MSYTYAERKKAPARADAAQKTAPERAEALRSGAVKPTAAELGHRVDLPEAMRAKMEASFGADLSAVKLYQSQAVADAGAEAITQGSSIAFAPGKLDFTSYGGQALLGHELSHVVSQQRGEVTGGGFLNDHALEARADREGAMAARGESVTEGYGGAVAPLSAASAAGAAGPMQAKCGKNVAKTADRMEAIYADQELRKIYRERRPGKKEMAWYNKQLESGDMDLAKELQRRQVLYAGETINDYNNRVKQSGDANKDSSKLSTLSSGVDVKRQNVGKLLGKMNLKDRSALKLSDEDQNKMTEADEIIRGGFDYNRTKDKDTQLANNRRINGGIRKANSKLAKMLGNNKKSATYDVWDELGMFGLI